MGALPDGAVNSYLLKALIIAAGLSGLRPEPGPPHYIDLHRDGHTVVNAPKLPLKLLNALRELEKDTELQAAPGVSFSSATSSSSGAGGIPTAHSSPRGNTQRRSISPPSPGWPDIPWDAFTAPPATFAVRGFLARALQGRPQGNSLPDTLLTSSDRHWRRSFNARLETPEPAPRQAIMVRWSDKSPIISAS